MCGLSAFRALLHQHLGGPGAYTMFSQEITTVLAAGGIGPGIALTVFGRTEEVESGVLEMTAGSLKDGQQVRVRHFGMKHALLCAVCWGIIQHRHLPSPLISKDSLSHMD